MITGYATLTDESLLRVSGDYANGILAAAGLQVPPTAPQAKECVGELAAYNKDLAPSHFTMWGCLSAGVFVEALKRAGPDLTRAKLLTALESMKDYDTGVSGKVSFGPGQHMGLHEVIPFGIEQGKFVILGDPIKLPR